MSIDPLHSLSQKGTFQPPQIAVFELKRREGRSLWIVMGRQHHVVGNADRTVVLEAGIRLSFEQCDEDRPRSGQVPAAVFCGYHDGHLQRTSLTGGHLGRGSIYLPEGWRGRYLGTFAMSAVVRWAQQWSEAAIENITLADDDGEAENKDRRNRFYEQFGLRFTYDDDDRSAMSADSAASTW